MELLDFVTQPDQSRTRINEWIATQTNKKIPGYDSTKNHSCEYYHSTR